MNRALSSFVAALSLAATAPLAAEQTNAVFNVEDEARVKVELKRLSAETGRAAAEIARAQADVIRLAQASEEEDAELEARIEAAQARLEAAAMEIAELTSRIAPEAMRFVRDIRISGSDRAVIGINISSSSEDEGEVEGVRVVGVSPGGPAQEAGIETGDVIVSLNGTELGADSNKAANDRLSGIMDDVEPGDSLEIVYKRGDRRFEVAFEAGSVGAQSWAFAPDADGFNFDVPNFDVHMERDAPYVFAISRHSVLGDMELTEISEGLSKYFGTDTGLLVVKAPEDDRIPLEDGDVIQKIGDRVPDSPKHAMRILRSYEPGETLSIEVIRDKRRRELSFEFPERAKKSGRG